MVTIPPSYPDLLGVSFLPQGYKYGWGSYCGEAGRFTSSSGDCAQQSRQSSPLPHFLQSKTLSPLLDYRHKIIYEYNTHRMFDTLLCAIESARSRSFSLYDPRVYTEWNDFIENIIHNTIHIFYANVSKFRNSVRQLLSCAHELFRVYLYDAQSKIRNSMAFA